MGSKSKPNCGVCGTEKVKRGSRLICLVCARRYARDARVRNGKPFTLTANSRRAKAKYRNKVRADGLTNQKVYSLRKLYGIEPNEYFRLLRKQDHQCAICRDFIFVDACVDHCHQSNRVRGLLCRHCNMAIGLFVESPHLLRNAATYLERFTE